MIRRIISLESTYHFKAKLFVIYF